MATHQVLIASYEKDFPFLEHCLWSLKRFCTGFLPPVVVVSSTDYPRAKALVSQHYPGAVVRIRDGRPDAGFMRAQLAMMEGDIHCTADFIWLLGSDCFVHEPLRPEQFFIGGKPLMLCNSYEYLAKQGRNEVCWKTATQKLLGFVTEFETMVWVPLVYPRKLYGQLRGHVESLHRECFDACVYSTYDALGGVSESNLLGGFAYHNEPSIYHWVNVDGAPLEEWRETYPNPVAQFWSHGGLDCPSDRPMKYCGGEMLGKTFRQIIEDVRRENP